jgi:hypothetical protein
MAKKTLKDHSSRNGSADVSRRSRSLWQFGKQR